VSTGLTRRTDSPTVQGVSNQTVLDYFADLAAVLDRGEADVRSGLRKLGAEGLLGLGTYPDDRADQDGDFVNMVGVVADIAAECLSSAFAVWGQRMVVEYLSQGTHRETDANGVDALVRGAEFGATAMAPALRDIAGIEPVPVTAKRTERGLLLTGKVRWASNLFPGGLVVLPARVQDGSRVVVCLRTTDPGVSVKPAKELLALNATASGSVELEGAQVAADGILSEDLAGFVRAIRPAFLLLQTAFCSGLARRSLAEARSGLVGLNECFAAEAANLDEEYASVHERLFTLSARRDPTRVRELLQVRLDAAGLATAATRLEATVRGGLGYVAGSHTARRLREAAFLPIQAPTEGQLRWELSQYA
jgi:alkylation response protein AidB-like acyl-CoA dehydrogenase